MSRLHEEHQTINAVLQQDIIFSRNKPTKSSTKPFEIPISNSTLINGQAKPLLKPFGMKKYTVNKTLGEVQQNPHDTSVLTNDARSLMVSDDVEMGEAPASTSENVLTQSDDIHDLHASSKSRTGFCYDVRMRYHSELDPPKERLNYHPEDPRRIFHIYRELCTAGLIDDKTLANTPLVENPLMHIPAREARKDELILVHTKRHVDFIWSTKDKSEEDLLKEEQLHDSVYFHPLTNLAALLSAGGAIDTCRTVAGGALKNAIAIIRPPGHHAELDRPMGFCMFDNVAIAAKVCQIDFRETCRKILIVDWDVHHGNGIQQAFESDPNVLYISLHVHEDGKFYPPGSYGDHLHCGKGPGIGKNINIPWSTKGMGDADYIFAFQNVVMPAAIAFNPDFVIIAAGFDAAAGDQLGGCFVSPTGYAHMTHMLMSLAGGKIVACLEGGYNLKSISLSALAVTRTMMGEPPDRLQETTPTESGVATVQKVVMHQSKYWKTMYPKNIDSDLKAMRGERMHDVIRTYQTNVLYDNYKMTSLFIYRDGISKSFENQVLATPNREDPLPLLVIFHDPPKVMGVPDPVTHQLELHNSWLADAIKQYIGWAVKQDYAVIDINIPKHLTGIDDEEGYFEEDKSKRQLATEELAVYLWQNYIECNDSTDIFFLGIGDAYHGILHLLNNQEKFFERIRGVINFVCSNPIRPVTDKINPNLSKWYIKNSLIFVANNHLLWSPDRKPPSKRFGALIKSPVDGLNEMLLGHQEQVQKFIKGKVKGRWVVRESWARMVKGGG